ncbi:phosphonate ABC transporter, permease protein PhnE [Ornithinimicrobium pratense]|uniref:Phosphonate ABC transporter, permease protein PhnE n=1 Tax=Ornithinimicrobium pratense TaxID=2593973 RepID=A0A5J6V3U6_9MICO|nr:phosphonate ABC transporter, permease protein PhnE [Ornithinimicrobium pratense]QFG68395.1 phosphonate ABC transporter, permease protein PhnE [Ornithinimicrobium pratense]
MNSTVAPPELRKGDPERSPEQSVPPVEQDRRTIPLPSLRGLLAWAIVLAFVSGGVWSIIDLRINIASLADSWDNAVRFMRRTLPLDFPPWVEVARTTAYTLAIVLLATVLAVVLSTAVALLAARTTCRSPGVRGAARAFIVLMRALPELVLAIIFIRIFGFGAMAGVLALGLHSIGMVGKMYADAIEDQDDGPRRSLESAGATRLQQIFGATIPGVLPAMVATGLHRFDINLRASVILGFVGIGGIGADLSSALSTMNYSRGMALALVVLVLCIATELISGLLRMRLLGRSEPSRFGVLWAIDRARSKARGQDAQQGTIPPWDGARITRLSYLGLSVLAVVASLWYAEIDWQRFLAGFGRIPDVAQRFWPPSTGGHADVLLDALVTTFQIALAATLLGVLVALPVGILAARNVVRNKAVAQTFRTIIVVTRGIPELILAIVLVIISGLGAVAGTLALAIGATGLFSKLVADSIEETDVRVQEAVSTAGASHSQVLVAATLRQAAPSIASHLIYQLDVNFRSATLLGIVGAGGIGFYLLNATRVLQFEVVTFILLLVMAVVLALEGIAVLLRRIVR